MPARSVGHADAETSAQSSPAMLVPGVATRVGRPAASEAVRHAAVSGSTPTTRVPHAAPQRAAAAASEPTPVGTNATSKRSSISANSVAYPSMTQRAGPDAPTSAISHTPSAAPSWRACATASS